MATTQVPASKNTTASHLDLGNVTLVNEAAFDFSLLILPSITATRILQIGLTLVVVVGITCNCLSMATMLRRKLRKLSTCMYLTVLAASDNLVLLDYGTSILVYAFTGVDIGIYLGCTLIPYVAFFGSQYSAWILVLTTADRFMKLKNHTDTRPSWVGAKPRLLSACLALGLLVFNIPTFFVYKKLQGYMLFCGTTDTLVTAVWPGVASVMGCFLPALLITILNVLTIFQMRAKRVVPTTTLVTPVLSKHGKRITTMLVVTASSFVILVVPVTSYFIWATGKFDIRSPVWSSVLVLYFVNHSINFFLYCASASTFRKEFFQMITKPSEPVPSTRGAEAPAKPGSLPAAAAAVQSNVLTVTVPAVAQELESDGN